MQKPDVFPRFIQLCFKLLHISGFNYFTWQRIPVIYHPVGETELPQIQPAWLLHDFHSMAMLKVVSYYDLSVLSMSVMGFRNQKSFDRGVGG